MISFELMLYSVLIAGGYLLVLSFILDGLERKLKLSAGLPEEIVESTGISWTLGNFTMELLFYVAIPTLVYSFFYYLLPFYGVRAGVASALFAFGLGVVPAMIGLAVRVKLPMPYLMFMLFSVMLKLIGCLALIGYLYTL